MIKLDYPVMSSLRHWTLNLSNKLLVPNQTNIQIHTGMRSQATRTNRHNIHPEKAANPPRKTTGTYQAL